MPEWFIYLCGWGPAIIFPGASVIQLCKLFRSKTAEGVSKATWALFAFANLCGYVYLEKYLEPQALGYVFAAVVQVGIVAVAIAKGDKPPTS